jgi:hypothetical protein
LHEGRAIQRDSRRSAAAHSYRGRAGRVRGR